MFNLITIAFAQATQPAPAQDVPQSFLRSPIILMIFMIVIFYFILIRPSQKREKERKKMIDAIQKGDKVLTSGGIYGVVVNVKPEENIVVIKIADGTKVDFAKSAIQTKIS